MNALTMRALATFPDGLREEIRSHAFADELDDLVQQAALALLEAGGAAGDVFRKARSATRRFTQNPAYYGVGIDDLALAVPDADDEPTPTPTRRQVRKQIEADLGISTRAAQRALKKQLARVRENGDLFVADESGVAA